MPNAKLDNELNLSLDIPEQEREKATNLNVGYSPEENTWELIVKYSGSLERIREELNVSVVELLNEYAVITIPESQIDRLSDFEEIEFIEKPKRLFYEVIEGRRASCINPLQTPDVNLFGEGVLIGVIDSGIDYSHPDFRNEDGTTRIAALWDQTIRGNPPAGYDIGTLYTRDQINEALQVPMPQRMEIVPSTDISGHGTHVAGIAAGNGRASNGLYRGVASKSELVVVKLGTSVGDSFPRTTQLMQGIDYVIRYAIESGRPMAINISFGNNYGSHTGRTLLESYINDVANLWKTSIVIGTGNEGASGNHAQGILTMGTNQLVEIAVSEFEFSLNIQIWKNYFDHFDISIIAPNGTRVGPIPRILGKQQFTIGQTGILLYYGDPTPYNPQQEIYIELIPTNRYINAGVWGIELVPRRIVVGNYDMWLPAGGVKNPGTRFLLSSEYTTLTVPSTAVRAISVGAYNAYTDSYAPFSGRGFTRNMEIKPDLVAPGVNINSCSPGGGYTVRSGTSMATPFVTGSAALLMQWGIVRGNDPFLYGEKVKAYLINGARHLRIENVYPNRTLGYGALCLESTFDNIR
ncbi:S8 family peptidase [Lachnospiraceae bacterium MD1]|uniref:S8 family peptidase n=1 Tax=Variimorphobacter saccharofermentans TaxID=2755051 RepID=A0A839K2J4_9FIRM|nr:S8 family peptidase [Variimorphobacter saccharofermentans]MBB2184034.1 S8 family peptidase [Variimorphobacter saccharofermentans]